MFYGDIQAENRTLVQWVLTTTAPHCPSIDCCGAASTTPATSQRKICLFLIARLLSGVVNIQYRRILKRVAGCNQRTQSGSLNSKHVARLIFSISPLKSLPMETQRQMIAVKRFLRRGRGEGGNFIVLTYFMTLSGLSSVPEACLYFHAAISWPVEATKALPTV